MKVNKKDSISTAVSCALMYGAGLSFVALSQPVWAEQSFSKVNEDWVKIKKNIPSKALLNSSVDEKDLENQEGVLSIGRWSMDRYEFFALESVFVN